MTFTSRETSTCLGWGEWGADGLGQASQRHGGTLTAVGLIGVVVAIEVAITAPQLEGTVSVSTGKLVGLTGRGWPCGTQQHSAVAYSAVL